MNLEALYLALDLEVLRTQGPEDIFQCPDPFGVHKHGDRTGKLCINREKGLGHCWACMDGFNIPQLVGILKGMEIEEAQRWLKQFEEEDSLFDKQLDQIFEKEELIEDIVPHFNESILEGLEGHSFFAERGISEDVRKRFRCGYDKERNAIVFPHFFEGKLVGTQRRNFEGPKYTNTSNFPKKQTIWSYDESFTRPFVVESVPTALRLISEGFEAVATFGASISPDQIKLLKKYDQLILARDNDKPGEDWFKAIINNISIPCCRVGLVEGRGSDLGDIKGPITPFVNETLEYVFSSELSLKI